MSYEYNPKTNGSGIIACIPQTGTCPNKCEDCFFQSGRSFLEPLTENLPNIPTMEQVGHRIVRVNDGNDSNVKRDLVIEKTNHFTHRFFNTAINKDLDSFPGPVVLTLNPGINNMTDNAFHKVNPIPTNLMFVRARVNMWNLELVDQMVDYYTSQEVPVILTFMAYYNETIPENYKHHYIFRKRTLNSYWAITTSAWKEVMNRYEFNYYVYSCGKIEGEKGNFKCSRCGNCLREYFNTLERI